MTNDELEGRFEHKALRSSEGTDIYAITCIQFSAAQPAQRDGLPQSESHLGMAHEVRHSVVWSVDLLSALLHALD